MSSEGLTYQVTLRGTPEMMEDAYQRMTRGLQRSKAGFTVWLRHANDMETALAAQPATGEGLDVERLALAECREGRIDGSGACTHHRALAIEHAAEYAVLQPASEENR